MKFIVAQWFSEDSCYGKAMRVISSSHPRFSNGTRFDYGFLQIASCEGYAITIIPSEETLDLQTWKDGSLVEREVNKK